MATMSQVSEAVYRARFDNQMSAGAQAAQRAMESLGVAVEQTDQRVTRAERSAKSWVNAADQVTQAARRAEKAKRDLANAEQALAQGVQRGEVSQEQAARALENLRQKAQQAEARLRALQAASAPASDAAQILASRLDAAAAAAQRAAQYQAALNQALGVQARGADDYARRAADIAAYGAELDRLRAKFSPLFAAQQQYRHTLREIAEAERVGALTAREAAEARERTKASFAAQIRTMNEARAAAEGGTNAIRLQAYQWTNLGYQIQDVAVQLAGGQNPLLVMIQQGPQATAAVGGVSNAWRLLASVITPARVAIVAATAAMAAFAAITESSERTINALQNRLRATRADYEAMATAADEASRRFAAESQFSTGQSRDAARILASPREFAGSREEIQRLLRVAADLATVMGQDLPAAAETLARAMRDPAAVAREFADGGLLRFNEGTARQIELLQRSGQRGRAYVEVMRQIAEATQNAAQNRTSLERALEELGNKFEQLWLQMRPVVEGLVRLSTISLDNLMRGGFSPFNPLSGLSAGIERALGVPSGAPATTGAGGAAPGASAPTPVPPSVQIVEEAMRRVREINPRLYQQQNLSADQALLRQALPYASPEQARALRAALGELGEQLKNLRGPVAEHLEGLREQATLAQAADGAARALAEATLAVAKAGGNAAAQEEARRLVQQRLNGELANYLDGLNRQINGADALVEAHRQGAEAVREVEARIRAEADALRYAEENTDLYTRTVNVLTVRYRELAEAQARARSAAVAREMRNQLELLRTEAQLLGENEAVRSRELAILRERQRLTEEGIRAGSEEYEQRVRLAAAIADQTTALARQSDAWRELQSIGERVFDRIGAAITEAFVQGRGEAVNFGNVAKAVLAEVAQAVFRMAVLRPVMNAIFGTNYGTLFDALGGGGGSSGGAVLLLASAASQAGGGGGLSLVPVGGSGGAVSLRLAPVGGGGNAAGIAGNTGLLTNFNQTLRTLGAVYDLFSGQGGYLLGSTGIPFIDSIMNTTLWGGGTVTAAEAAKMSMNAYNLATQGVTVGSALSGLAGIAGGAYGIYSGLQRGGVGGYTQAAGGALMGASAAASSGLLGAAAASSAIPVYGWIAGAVLALASLFLPGAKTHPGGAIILGSTGAGEFGVLDSRSKHVRDFDQIDQQVRQQVEEVNRLLFERGISVRRDAAGPFGYLGFGPAAQGHQGQYADIPSMIMGNLHRLTSGNPYIEQMLRAGRISSLEELIGGADWIKNVYEPLLKAQQAVSSWDKRLEEINYTFGEAVKGAERLGLATDRLVQNWEKAKNELSKEWNLQFQSIEAGLVARRAQVLNDPALGTDARLRAFGLNAQVERQEFARQLRDLNLHVWNPQEFQRLMDDLAEIQRLERERLQRDLAMQRQQAAISLDQIAAQLGLRRAQAEENDPASRRAQLRLFDLAARLERLELEARLQSLGADRSRIDELVAEMREVQKLERERLRQQLLGQDPAAVQRRAQIAAAQVTSLVDYARSLTYSPLSPLSPQEQFRQAERQFQAVAGAAAAGDWSSIMQIQSYADAYLQAARGVYGSGTGFVEVFRRVTDALERVGEMAPNQLTDAVYREETRRQTDTLRDELVELRQEVRRLRAAVEQGSRAPARIAA